MFGGKIGTAIKRDSEGRWIVTVEEESGGTKRSPATTRAELTNDGKETTSNKKTVFYKVRIKNLCLMEEMKFALDEGERGCEPLVIAGTMENVPCICLRDDPSRPSFDTDSVLKATSLMGANPTVVKAFLDQYDTAIPKQEEPDDDSTAIIDNDPHGDTSNVWYKVDFMMENENEGWVVIGE